MKTAIDSKTVSPCNSVSGTLSVPGDKSISHRVAMLSALANGESVIEGFLQSEDCLNTLNAVEQLGVSVSREGGTIRIKGAGGSLSTPDGPLDMGNSGTGMRLLAGILAGQGFDCEMTGDKSLCTRPMKRIKEPLDLMGGSIELLGSNGRPPIQIKGRDLQSITYKLPVASAQVKSCVLLAGLAVRGTTTVIEPRPCRDHTELMLRAMGIDISVDGCSICLKNNEDCGCDLAPGHWRVPGDFSSSAFWIVAASLKKGSELLIKNVGLNPRRTALLDVLLRMGATIEYTRHDSDKADIEWEPVGDIIVQGGDLHGTEIGGDEIPNLIDELPIVALAAALCDGKTVIRDAAELRVKESDRIATMATNLSLLGVKVEEKEDGMIIYGNGFIQGGVTVDSHGDHRIAMAMAVAGLLAREPVEINDVACVATSYPGFWSDLDLLSQ